jgi:poly(A) polymerase
MAVPINPEQRKAAAALLRERVPDVAGIGRLFTDHGHELALVGGPVRDVFLGQRPGDLDLTTDATPEQVLAMTQDWADKTWTVGIAFGTVGLRKGNSLFEITTYRSEQYGLTSRRGGPGPPGFHHQRDGGQAARIRDRRSLWRL